MKCRIGYLSGQEGDTNKSAFLNITTLSEKLQSFVLELVKRDQITDLNFLRNITNLSNRTKDEILKISLDNFKFIQEPTADQQMSGVRYDLENIGYIEHPTKEVIAYVSSKDSSYAEIGHKEAYKRLQEIFKTRSIYKMMGLD